MEDNFTTIQSPASAQIKIKDSRFIGYMAPCEEQSTALDFIQSITKKHYDATHNCFAYRFWEIPSPSFRYSDDGEPSGTAGRPILDAIEHKNYFNIVCVVTRYFGGTKLGTGGLARAYRECTEVTLALTQAKIIWLTQAIKIQFEYDLTGTVMSFISQHPIKVLDSIYGENTELILSVRQSKVESVRKELMELSAGKIHIEAINES